MFGIFKAMKELRQEQEYFRNECLKVERDFEQRAIQLRLKEEKLREINKQEIEAIKEAKSELDNQESRLNERFNFLFEESRLFSTRLAASRITINLLEKELENEKAKSFEQNNMLADLAEKNRDLEKSLTVAQGTIESISKDNKDETIQKLQDRIHTLEVEIARLTPCKGVLS